MKHQVEWLDMRKDLNIALCKKGRRTGITFAEAMDDTLIAATRKSDGGDNIWYIADTKDKGLEFIGYCAKFSRVIAKAQGQGISEIEQFLFGDQNELGETKWITAWRIRYSSGHRITALSSRPENIHGLQGIVVIDEAALHPDVEGVLESATALLIWGGQIRIISTHRGKKNPFNQLAKDIEAGQYGRKAKTYKVTFDDAVANGLYERVCYMKGIEPTAEGKKEWYTDIRAAYGPRKAAMREELDAIPRDGSGTSIPGIWIENAMKEKRPVLRLVLGDDFANRSESDRKRWCDDWIKRYLKPVLDTLNKDRQHVFGMDFARHRHFSIIMPCEITPMLYRRVPFIIEMNNVPTRQQEQILWYVIKHLPKFRSGAIDATGPGQTIAEYTADKFGRHVIHEVTLSQKWYGENMQPFIDSFEDGVIDLPVDESLESDLRAVEDSGNGIPMVPRLERKDLKDPDLVRHGDAAIAGALMWFASLNKATAIDFIEVLKGRRNYGDKYDDDDIVDEGAGGW